MGGNRGGKFSGGNPGIERSSRTRALSFVNFPLLSISAILAVPAAPLSALFVMSRVRTRVIRRNFDLTRASGLKPPALLRIRLGFHLARDLLSLLLPGTLPRPRLHARSRAALARLRGGPSFLLTAHFGNWEAQAAAWGRHRVPLLGAARPLKGAVPRSLLAKLRARHGIHVVSNAVPRAALRHLHAGGCFGLLWDQHAPDSVRPGSFFGVPVSLNPLPAFLLARVPCPAYFGILLPGGTLRLIPLLDSRQIGRAGWEDRLARRYHRVLETLIRRHPARWYGVLHARFKTVEAYPGHRVGSRYTVHSGQ